jgi:hypothetical protein
MRSRPRRRGRLSRVTQRHLRALARNGWPAGLLAAGGALLAALTASPWPLWAGLGAAGYHLAVRGFEACAWWKAGGRAERKRERRRSGLAPMWEVRARLGRAATRAACRRLRPSLTRWQVRRLPAWQAGVPLGRAVRTR